jgi:Ni/Fe-hydrogenase subunit HybB-like protein
VAEYAATTSRLHQISDGILDALAWTRIGWLTYWGIVGLCGFVWSIAAVVWAYQVYAGFEITGMNHPVMWAFYITAFVFWIGIAHSGTLVSAILFLFRAHWRTPIARIAETMTIVAVPTAALFPIIHLGRSWRVYWLIPYPNQRGLWINFSSPLIWDAAAVATYFVVSLLFWFMNLVPDFALLRDRSQGWPRRIYRWLALGWSGTAGQWRYFRSAYTLLAALITALVISVHSIVSWDFAVALVPGWHSSIFAPYFVAGAILSGLAMLLTLAIPGRELLGIRQYVTNRHLERIAKLIFAMSLIVTYAYAIEFFSAWLGDDQYTRTAFATRPAGHYAPLFWISVACNSIVPLTFFFAAVRRSPGKLFAASLLINAGMWSERLLIIVSSLSRDFNAYSWGNYLPRWPELTIVAGSAAWFLFWFLLIIGHVPPVPIADMKEAVLEGHDA